MVFCWMLWETLTMTLIGTFQVPLKQQGATFSKENLIYVVEIQGTGTPQEGV